MTPTTVSSNFGPAAPLPHLIGSLDTRRSAPDKYDLLTAPHLKSLSRFVRGRMKSDAEAEDVIQDTLLLACRHINQFRFEASIGTWLRRIALNVMRGRWRRHESTRVSFVDPVTLDWMQATDTHSPLMEAQVNQINRRLHSALSKLPPQYRTVVELHDFQGLSLGEIAGRLASSISAVKSRHHRAKCLLSQRFSESVE